MTDTYKTEWAVADKISTSDRYCCIDPYTMKEYVEMEIARGENENN